MLSLELISNWGWGFIGSAAMKGRDGTTRRHGADNDDDADSLRTTPLLPAEDDAAEEWKRRRWAVRTMTLNGHGTTRVHHGDGRENDGALRLRTNDAKRDSENERRGERLSTTPGERLRTTEVVGVDDDGRDHRWVEVRGFCEKRGGCSGWIRRRRERTREREWVY